uniref:Uncharacterized protein n=1 Tax=Oryza barthii TaxID=65489 RepID=A0A0D3EL16_9ORYZ
MDAGEPSTSDSLVLATAASKQSPPSLVAPPPAAAMTRPFLIVPTGGRDTLAAVVKGINGRGASPPWRPASPRGQRLRGMSNQGAKGEAQRDERHGGRRSVVAATRVEDGDAAVAGWQPAQGRWPRTLPGERTMTL